MSLRRARALSGSHLRKPPGAPPWACADLEDWVGCAFTLPMGDARLESLFAGESPSSRPLHNLVGAADLWEHDPEWMDWLATDSPAHDQKMLERDLYLHHWGAHLAGARRVLDLGAGAGRFTQWLLAHDREVEAVDPDLRSLWRILAHVAGGPGRIDLHWTTGERLPAIAPVDLALAVEVLNYVEDPAVVVANIARVLEPGGVLLLSVEAKYGWAASMDAGAGSLGALFDDSPVFLERDRWIRTYSEDDLQALLEGWEILEIIPTHYATSGPFEDAAGANTIAELLPWEKRCREHPLTAPWNRAWTVAARKPLG
jgi:SAM-dependent methyltransferase